MKADAASGKMWTRTLSNLNKFFFAEERPYGIALTRISLPLVLLTLVIPRWFFVRELYTTDGAVAQVGTGFGHPEFLPVLSPAIAIALHSLQILSLICVSLGWQTRIATILSALLFNYFCMLDVLGTVSKLTVISGHGLLLLSLSPAGKVWSVDAWLKSRKRLSLRTPFIPDTDRHPIWTQRLVQLLIAIIYFAASITKVHTAAYFSGDQMTYWLVTNINGPKPVGEYLTEYPGFLVLASYIGFVWEVLFIFFCWNGWGRRLVVGMGVLFHAGTFVMLGLQSFPMVMFSLYLCFLNEADFRWGMSLLRRVARRSGNTFLRFVAYGNRTVVRAPLNISPAVSLMVFLVVALASAAGGIEAERRCDLYGKLRPEGGYPLRELSLEETAVLLGEAEPLREFDKVFSFEVGTLEMGGKLWNRKKEFRPGDRIICEVGLNPPHEDTWLECALLDASGRTISRPGETALRENLRTFFTFNLAENIEPGEYAVALYIRGEEIIRRSFKILGNGSFDSAPLAN